MMQMRTASQGGPWSAGIARHENSVVVRHQRTLFERAGARSVRASKDMRRLPAESFFPVHKGDLGLAGEVKARQQVLIDCDIPG